MTTAASTGMPAVAAAARKSVGSGLADDEVRLATGCHRQGGDDRAGAGLEPFRVRVDRIAIGGHEPCSVANGLGGQAEAVVAQGEVDADDDRIRRRLEPEAGRGDRLDANVTKLPREALATEDHDAADGWRALDQDDGGGAGRGHDHRRVGGGTHAAQSLDVLGPVPARVVGGVDDTVASAPRGRSAARACRAPGDDRDRRRHRDRR